MEWWQQEACRELRNRGLGQEAAGSNSGEAVGMKGEQRVDQMMVLRTEPHVTVVEELECDDKMTACEEEETKPA